MGHEFDVFISYRRVGGDAIAQFLKQNLLRRRLRVFLDVSDLKSGHFGQAISSTIASTPNFVVVLTPGALDLCEDENDWLRREIAQGHLSREKHHPDSNAWLRLPKSSTERGRGLVGVSSGVVFSRIRRWRSR